MTRGEEQELLELTRQNNELLRAILHLVQHDEANDFIHNVIANLVGNRIDPYNNGKNYRVA
jgi:hypothetical protein